MNDINIYYVIYSPKTIRMASLDFGWDTLPEIMKKGYYISGLPIEPWNIKYKGTLEECMNIMHSINMFVYN